MIKEFTEVGLYNVESGILWVWREVFISLLASKSNKTLVKLLPELLAEVDDILGWRGLERLIAGGESRAWSVSCSVFMLLMVMQ